MKIHWALGCVLVLASQTGIGQRAFGQEADAEVDVEPEARASLEAAFDRLETAESLSFRVRRVFDVVQENGQKLQFGTSHEVLLRRPDRARVTLQRDDGQERRLFYDGAELFVLDVGENAYARFAVPPTIDAMLDFVEMEVGSGMPLADLLYNDLDPLIDAALEGAVVGTARVEDLECEHLAFRSERLDFQIWIDPDHVIRKIVITDTDAEGEPQVGALLREWNFEAEAPDAAFVFEAPEGAERIPTLARPVAFAISEEEEE